MAPQLPCELEEEILSRLAPQSLIRFRSVCKKWNSLFNDKSFLNNHLSHSRPQFIFVTNYKIYSIDIIDHNSIYPTIELRELPFSDIPNFILESIKLHDTHMSDTVITACDEFLFFNSRLLENDTALWNPWLRQVKCIENEDLTFFVVGLGYDNSRPEKVYKILGYSPKQRRIVIYECASHPLKLIDKPDEDCHITSSGRLSNVSLNGNLYWVTHKYETDECFIQSFDFSMDNFKPFCLLPCQKNHDLDELILAVYKGDRFSLLKQCYETRNIEMWVTKKNIDRKEEEVVWINLMTLPTTNFPTLSVWSDHISYFIYEKTLFMCCPYDKTEVCFIYIVRKDLCKKIQIGSGIANCCYCVYTPNLISFPLFRGSIE